MIRLGVVTAPTELVCSIGWLAMTVYLSVLEAENDVILATPGHATFGTSVVTCFNTFAVAFADNGE